MLKKLFILLLLQIPLLVVSQTKQPDIELKENGNYEITQLTAEAMYYAKVERDSLLKEVKHLREQNAKLIEEKQQIIDFTLVKIEKLTNSLKVQDQLSQTIDSNNIEVINVWKKITKKSSLNVFSQLDIQDVSNIYLGANLNIPVALKTSISTTVLMSPTAKPIYLVGGALNIF